MHRFTQNVVKSARLIEKDPNVEAVTWSAAWALMSYFIMPTGWSPNPAVVPMITIDKWYQSGQRKTEGLVKQGWEAKRNRSNILELAALQTHIGMMLNINDGLEWPPTLIYVCNELDTYGKWPELHDVKKFYPPVPAPAFRYQNTAAQVRAANAGVYGPLNANTAGMIEHTKRVNDALWQSTVNWDQQKVLQEKLSKKP